MVDELQVRDMLTSLLESVAAQARADAKAGKSDIASIWKKSAPEMGSLDPAKIDEAIKDIDRATATKEGASRIVNALMVAARVVARTV